jgi:hypothetical protein
VGQAVGVGQDPRKWTRVDMVLLGVSLGALLAVLAVLYLYRRLLQVGGWEIIIHHYFIILFVIYLFNDYHILVSVSNSILLLFFNYNLFVYFGVI